MYSLSEESQAKKRPERLSHDLRPVHARAFKLSFFRLANFVEQPLRPGPQKAFASFRCTFGLEGSCVRTYIFPRRITRKTIFLSSIHTMADPTTASANTTGKIAPPTRNPHRMLIIQFRASHMTPVVEPLFDTFTDKLRWNCDYIELCNADPSTAQAELAETVNLFIKESSPNPDEKVIIYYGGCAFADPKDGSWRWHAEPPIKEGERENLCMEHISHVDPSVALNMLVHENDDGNGVGKDVLFLFHCPFSQDLVTLPQPTRNSPSRQQRIHLFALPTPPSLLSPDELCSVPGCGNSALTTERGWDKDLRSVNVPTRMLWRSLEHALQSQESISVLDWQDGLPMHGWPNPISMSIMGDPEGFVLTKGTFEETAEDEAAEPRRGEQKG